MTIPAPDPQTFDWIKGALDGSMSAVMSQVQLAEQESDVTQLATVPGNLHQINGSLRMVELEAAGMLAEDLEALCQKICDEVDQVGLESNSDDLSGLATLREGLDALRAYIDAISRQTPVSPLGLVDHINAVRRHTGRDSVSRFELFHPPLTLINAGRAGVVEEDDEDAERRRVPDDLRIRLVTQLRRKYRRALVSWLANRHKKGSSERYLGKINDLLQHLFRISSLDVSQQLWWVAGGFVEAVAAGDIDTDTRIKSQFARLDIEISRLEDENTSAIAVDPPDLLLRQMLFHIGAVEGSQSERVRQIQGELNLNEWFDRDDSQYRQLVTTSAELATLAEQYDLSRFSEMESEVNAFFSSFRNVDGKPSIDDPSRLQAALGELNAAVRTHGPESLAGLISEVAGALNSIADEPGTIPDTQADIKIASALLFVRDSVNRPNSIDVSWPQSLESHLIELRALADPSSDDSERALRVRKIAEVEYQHARSAIAAQLREILGGLEKLLTASPDAAQAAGFDSAALTEASTGIGQVASVLEIAGTESASRVATALSESLAAFGSANETPQDENLEHMAFAVASLGVAADHLSRRGPEADNVLNAALDRLQQIDLEAIAIAEPDRVDNDTPFGNEDAIGADTDSPAVIAANDEQPARDPAAALISELDYQRRQLRPGSHDGIRGLMGSFESLTDLANTEDSSPPAPVGRLAQMGQTICSNLLEQETGIDPERRDFLGLLVRQLGDISAADSALDNSADAGVDLAAWQRRLNALTELPEKTTDPDDVSDPEPEDSSAQESASQPEPEFEPEPVSIADAISPDDDNAGLLKLDTDLRNIFVEEFGIHLHKLREELNNYRVSTVGSRDARRALQEVDDCIHTLSGNCRNLGFDSAADCAELGASGLLTGDGSDPAVDEPERKNVAMARFAEALLMLGQVRQQVRGDGTVDAETEQSLAAFIAKVRNQPTESSEDVARDVVEESASEETDKVAAGPTVGVVGVANDVPSPAGLDTADESGSEEPLSIVETSRAAPAAPAPVAVDNREAVPVVDQSDVDEDIDEEIREIFIEESESILTRINGHLMSWRSDGADDAVLSGIRREFHTLKGSAAATGFTDISELSHRVESLLDQRSLDPDAGNDLFTGEQSTRMLDLLEEMHDGLAADLGIMQTEAKGHLPQLAGKLDRLLGLEPEEEQEQALEQPEQALEQPEQAPELHEQAPDHAEPSLDQEEEPEPDILHIDAKSSAEDNLVEDDDETESTGEEEPVIDEPVSETTDAEPLDAARELNNPADLAAQQVPDDASSVVSMPAPAPSEPRLPDEAGQEEHVQDEDSVVAATAETESWMPVLNNPAGQPVAADDAAPGSMLRIGNSRLAELINASGELSLVRTQLQDTLDATRMDLDVLRSSMSSMRAGLRDLELEADAQIRARPEQQNVALDDDFDPLQLDRYSRLQAKSREVTELLDQLAKVERDLDNRASNLDGALRQQLHLGDQLQSGLMSARMVNMTDYLPRLRYLVRETSRQADKPVELRFKGGDIQVDRQVIETMMAPLEHMIRNAVAHGIEDRDSRKNTDKPESGSVTLTLAQQGSELVVNFSDDGAGLDLDKLNARALELGLVESAHEVTEVHLLQVITQPGYSTADAVTMESGRGVGMDVVYQAVRDLGGSMTLLNTPGQGTTFQFRLPVTLALTQALLVRAGGWRFAVRSRTIERLMRVAARDVLDQEGVRLIVVEEQPVVLYSVRERLGETTTRATGGWLSVVLVRLADRLAAFEVDSFADSINIVSKPSGQQLASIPEISGITVLGDSSIVLILDPEAFVDRIAPVRAELPENIEAPRLDQLRRVLVVDDSLVVRKVMQKDLEADGLEVETAIDGVNALEVLERSSVDVALVDIEMPRMNGYELLERLRADSRYQSLPVIIITSRSGDQHRQRAMSLGADGYITKPYDISVLDSLMREVITNRSVLH